MNATASVDVSVRKIQLLNAERAFNAVEIGREFILIFEAVEYPLFARAVYQTDFNMLQAKQFMKKAGWKEPPKSPKPAVVKFYGHSTIVKEWDQWPPELKSAHVRWVQRRIEEERTDVLGR